MDINIHKDIYEPACVPVANTNVANLIVYVEI